jgi:hypothetical protein
MIGRAFLAVAVAAALLVGVTEALAATRASAPLPALSSLVLAPSDFRSGAGVASDTASTVSGLTTFARLQKPGVLGTTHLLNTISIVLLEPDATSAAGDFKQLDGEAQSTAGRQAMAKEWANAFVEGVKLGSHGKKKLVVKHTMVGAPVETPRGLRIPITMKTNEGTFRISLAAAQTDRALVVVQLLGVPNGRIASADAAKALAATQQHLQTAFTVANTAAPTINGEPTQGQSITVDEGSWTGAPSTYSYSWSRCDTSGANCAPIANATSSSYSLTSADAGSTVRVTVTGANSVSSQQGTSNPTATVT